ncbi:MAG: hypothetical protein JSU65_09400 [Candidatus Zixiibacteriota bacterium]|nr:MAG: hypothetical protein JSU65_09400 [candidate division Zixibacteria bacterium]
MEDGLLNRPTFMLIVIAATALIVKAIIDGLSKRKLIARGAAPEELGLGNSTGTRWQLIKNLKWALICIGFGTAVILTERFPNLTSTAGDFGFMFVGAGLGYLVYFLVAWRWLKKEDSAGSREGDNAPAGRDAGGSA